LAHKLIEERHLPRFDRLAQRKKEAVICWFCENCPDLVRNPDVHARDLAVALSELTPRSTPRSAEAPGGKEGEVPAEGQPARLRIAGDEEDLFNDWVD
jgi:hypothetical protein